jgi:hypothetical protein
VKNGFLKEFLLFFLKDIAQKKKFFYKTVAKIVTIAYNMKESSRSVI